MHIFISEGTIPNGRDTIFFSFNVDIMKIPVETSAEEARKRGKKSDLHLFLKRGTFLVTKIKCMFISKTFEIRANSVPSLMTLGNLPMFW